MTPTTVVTGFLGVGKTTAILQFFEHRPPDEKWAVLVNEFGDVGIDGAVLDEGGLAVKEIPGGCICCSAGLELKIGIVRLLREQKPDRLFVEPTGLAHPATIIDILRTPGIRESVDLRATIGLVDPRHFTDPRWADRDNYKDQVRIADVLVANRTDLADPADLDVFRKAAAELYPPKLAVLETTQGRIDPSWLHTEPAPSEIRFRPVPEHGEEGSRGWVFPPSFCFDREKLEDALHDIARPGALLPEGILRLKGVFRTLRVWLHVNGTPDQMDWAAINYRRDSRVEIIAPGAVSDEAWAAVEARLRASRWSRQ